jgi:hypothetical protein
MSTDRWTTWPDFDEDGVNDRTIIGLADGTPILVTCAGVPTEVARELANIINRVYRVAERLAP